MGKKTDKVLSIINYLFQFSCYIYMGFKCAQLMDLYEAGKDKVIIALLAFVAIFLWIVFHTIIHEEGHMFAGLASGYSFVSFRVGKITIIKTTYGFRIRKMLVLGTMGQCLMCPPSTKPDECPYKIYHLGGGLANILVSAVFLGIFETVEFNRTTFFFLFVSAMIGFAIGFSNLFPSKMGGIPNDGYNLLFALRKDLQARKCMNIVLTMNAMLALANNYSELNGDLRKELTEMDFDSMDITNPAVANAYILLASIYFADKKFDMAYSIYKRLLDTEGVVRIFKNEAKCECLFYNIIKNAPSSVIDGLYDKDLQVYIRATSLYPARHRLMYAYYLLYRKDSDKAMDELAELMKLIDVYAIKADVNLEFDIMNEIRIANNANS